jgi:hypothetical protein
MTTATQEPVSTGKDSKLAKSSGGRPVGYSPQLPFTTGKLVKGLAENAFKEFVKLNELCESGKATVDDLTDMLKKQATAGLEVRKAASLVWLTQGMLLHFTKQAIQSEGTAWMEFFDEELSGPLRLSPRSEQLQRKMFTDWQVATKALPAQTDRALEECEQVNDLAGKLKKLSAGRDPWEGAVDSDEPTLTVDKSTKERQAFQNAIEKLVEKGQKLGYPASTLGLLNDALDDFQTYSVDAVQVAATETATVVDVTDLDDVDAEADLADATDQPN